MVHLRNMCIEDLQVELMELRTMLLLIEKGGIRRTRYEPMVLGKDSYKDNTPYMKEIIMLYNWTSGPRLHNHLV
jgi:hypothetical protein